MDTYCITPVVVVNLYVSEFERQLFSANLQARTRNCEQ